MNKMFNKVTGDEGERIALNYIKKLGYKVIETNFRNKIGEIDIIAYDGNVLVFIEVKYKKSDYFGLPREAVNYHKQRKIMMVAQSYIKTKNLYHKVSRFDIVEILGQEVTHIKNCFV